jgi:hypothetical protein
MLKPRYLILRLALLGALMSHSLAQSQDQAPADQTPKAEQGAAQDKRGTKDQPLTVNIIPTAEQQTEAEKQAADTQRKAAAEEKLISYTGDLVLVGLVQFAVFILQLIAFTMQAIYMRQSAREMQKTTEAAERVSRDQIAHSHKVERAYISGGGARQTRRVEVPSVYAGAGPAVSFIDTGLFEFHVGNYGKTPGKIFQIGYGFCEGTDVPNTDPVYQLEYFDSWIDPGRSGLPIVAITIPPNLTQPVIFGRVYYETIFGERFSSGFLYRLAGPGASVSIRPPNLRYTDERKEN